MYRGALLATLHQLVSDRVLHTLLEILGDSEVSAEGLTGLVERSLSHEALAKWNQNLAIPWYLENRERQFREQHVTILTIKDVDYPSSLLELSSPPPILYVRGNVDVLKAPGIGICGSRKASEKGIQYAHRFGEKVAGLNVPEVSGYAQGVDIEAHLGALDAGGYTVVVLAEGIFRFRLRRPFQSRPLALEKMVIVSEFHPTRPWHVSNAMKRNKTICGLSKGLVVVEAQASSGTLDAGEECLRQGKPLLVIEYNDSSEMPEGNAKLIRHGGIPVHSGRELANQLSVIRDIAVSRTIGSCAEQLSLEHLK